MDGGGPKVSCADAQFPQTPAEGIGFFHLAGGDYAEEGLAKHAVLLAEMVHLVLRRLDLQQLFHGTVVPECVVCDSSGEHRQDWITKERSGIQALVHGVFWPVYPVSKNAVRSSIILTAGGEPFLRRPSHIFRIPHDLNRELGFSVFISKDAEGYILQEANSVRVLVHSRATLFCGVYSYGNRGRDRNQRGTWTRYIPPLSLK